MFPKLRPSTNPDASGRPYLIGRRCPVVSCDATGYEASHVSPYFGRRTGRRKHDFPKVSELIDDRSHVALASIGERGPASDSRVFQSLVLQAHARRPFDTLLADAGYDAQSHHEFLHRHAVFGIIPPRRGRPRQDGQPPGGATRALLHQEWPQWKIPYGQRWQSETRYSMHKRKLGCALRGRSDATHRRACLLRSITLNLMLESPHD